MRPLSIAITLIASAGAGLVAPAAAPAAIRSHTLSERRYQAGIVVRHELVTIDGASAEVITATMPPARASQGRVLEPVLPGNIVSEGTQTTSAVTRELDRYGTAVAINADLFEYATGQPSGLLVIDGDIFNQPQGGRPALAIDTDGHLSASRPKASGTLRLPGGGAMPFQINVRGTSGLVTYDAGWGRRTPANATRSLLGAIRSGSLVHRGDSWYGEATLQPLRTSPGSMAIPPNELYRMTFSAYGKRAAAQLARAAKGGRLQVRYRVGPLPTDIWSAVGGGPILVRGGQLVYRRAANREFSNGQLLPRDARTAVAQLADGRVLFYVVDMPGFTVAQVARDLRRRGARTAMAFDSGGSTAVSVDGSLLNKPSDGVERPVGNTLVYFAGNPRRSAIASVQIDEVPGESVPRLGFTMARRATVDVVLIDPGEKVHLLYQGPAGAGTHPVRIPPPIRQPGRWTLEVTAAKVHAHVVRRFRMTAAAKAAAAGAPAAAGAANPAAAARHASDDGGSALPWILGAAGLAAVAVVTVLAVRRRRRLR